MTAITKTTPPQDLAQDWDDVRSYESAAINHARLTVAAMVLSGWKLHAIKKNLGFMGSGRRKESGHGDHFKSWEEWLAFELPGLDRRTADRRIETYHAARRRLSALGQQQAIALLERGPQDQAERDQLEKLVHKITDGQTVAALFKDANIAKNPKSADGGHLAGKGATDGEQEEEPDDQTKVRQLAFLFFDDLAGELVAIRRKRDYQAYLAHLPLHSGDDDATDLTRLRRDLEALLADIKKAEERARKTIQTPPALADRSA